MKFSPILLAVLMSAATAYAQPPPAPPPGSPDAPHEPRKPLERWLNGLRERNPEEHQRLLDLRESDPEAFKRALSERRDRLRDRGPDDTMPELRRLRPLLAEMPPKERAEAVDKCAKFLQWQSKRFSPGPERARIDASEARVNELAQAYPDTPENERPALRDQIRTELNQIFDYREGQRQQQIEEAERHLNRLQQALKIRRQHHQEIVKRRLCELTGEPPEEP